MSDAELVDAASGELGNPRGGPEFQRFVRALPPDVRAALNARQLDAMAEALVPQRSPHWVDVRTSLPFPGQRVYVTLLVGKERRSRARLKAEGQFGIWPTLVVAGLFVAIIAASAAAAVMALSLLKGTSGFDMLHWPLKGAVGSSAATGSYRGRCRRRGAGRPLPRERFRARRADRTECRLRAGP